MSNKPAYDNTGHFTASDYLEYVDLIADHLKGNIEHAFLVALPFDNSGLLDLNRFTEDVLSRTREMIMVNTNAISEKVN